MMRKKLGLIGEELEDENLIVKLLTWMHKNQMDYTNTFYFLTKKDNSKSKIYNNQNFTNWKNQWEKRLKLNKNSPEKSFKLMSLSNPAVIPRNHNVEDALNSASEDNDLTKVHDLLKILQKPYDYNLQFGSYQSVPNLDSEKYKTFCGT